MTKGELIAALLASKAPDDGEVWLLHHYERGKEGSGDWAWDDYRVLDCSDYTDGDGNLKGVSMNIDEDL